MAESDDSFIGRWSRRKRGRAPQAELATPDAATPAPAEQASDKPAASDPGENEIVAQLPDIESLDENADFTVFLKQGVPEELRKRALRRLWRLNPVFANLDGLNDYDEDFTTAASVLESLKTVYQVGKGMHGSNEAKEAETDAGGIESDAAPASGEASPSEGNERLEADNRSKPQQIVEVQAAPIADQSDRVGSRQARKIPTTAYPDHSLRPSSGRSAARRRWGRFES